VTKKNDEKGKTIADSSSLGEEAAEYNSNVEELEVKGSWHGMKAAWAFVQYHPSTGMKDKNLVWKWS
jgi:hypothetical protein